jgi:hypothetical protein
MDFELSDKRLMPPKNIQVSNPKMPHHLLVVWDKVQNPDIIKIQNGSTNVSLIKEVKYNVYRAISLGGIFYKVNSDLVSDTRYEDNSVGLNPNTQYFYKISTVILLNDGLTYKEGPLSEAVIFFIPTENKWFKKMNERNMWILKNTGVLMDVYRRKTEGERCPVCYDPIREQ